MRQDTLGAGQTNGVGTGLDARLIAVLVEQRFDALVEIGNREEAIARFRNPAQHNIGPARRNKRLAGCRGELVRVQLDGDVEGDASAGCRDGTTDPLQRVEVVQALERRQTQRRRLRHLLLDARDQRLARKVAHADPVGRKQFHGGLEVGGINQPNATALIGVDDRVDHRR